jgi:arsenite-transporting ATPase
VRAILFTGKGGVGKSSIASASAIRLAELNQKTLIVSSDLAHNLSDIFDQPVGDKPTVLAENLYGLEVDVLNEIRENWDDMHEYFRGFLAYLGMEHAVAEEVVLVPGLDEIFLLLRIMKEIEGGSYAAVVIDCPPTGAMFRLMTLSDSAMAKMVKIVEVERKILKLFRPIGKRIRGLREIYPEDRLYESLGEVLAEVGRLGDLLKNPVVSSVRLVVNPERVPVSETRRAYTYLGLFGFPVDAIFVNKVLPEETSESYFDHWRDVQAEQLDLIRRSFLDTSIFPVRYLDHEPIGAEALGELGREIYGERPPNDVLSEVHTMKVEKEGEKTKFSLFVPNISKTDLDLQHKEDELLVTAGGYHRVITLPDSLMGREVESARYEEGRLTILFA